MSDRQEARSAASTLRCSVCGEEPGWSFPREGDPCWNDDGGKLVRAEQPAAQGHDQLFVNGERTVLVRIWANGVVEVARRESPDHTWGAPVYVTKEQI